MSHKMKYFVVLLVWVLLQLITYKNELESDGFLEVGYPFVFYRDFHGKSNNLEIFLGLNIYYLLLNILTYLIFMFFLNILFRKFLNINRSNK